VQGQGQGQLLGQVEDQAQGRAGLGRRRHRESLGEAVWGPGLHRRLLSSSWCSLVYRIGQDRNECHIWVSAFRQKPLYTTVAIIDQSFLYLTLFFIAHQDSCDINTFS